jgi:twitching motility protein PilT
VKLIESLLDAISRLEGDALIMHVGEKPYVVTSSASMYAYRGPVAWGHVELSSRLLTTDAVVGMLDQLLPPEQRKALDEYGAVEYELAQSGPTSDGFTVVAARGGDDVWLEIRRTPATLGALEVPAAPPVEVATPVAIQPSEHLAFPSDERPANEERPVPEEQPEPQVQPAPEMQAAEEQPASEEASPVVEHHPVPEPVIAAAQPQPAAGAAPEAPAITEAAPPELSPPMVLDESAEADVPFEIVEDEPQLAPTHAEVDELLTTTAQALLSAGVSEPVEEPAVEMGAAAPPQAVEPQPEPAAQLPATAPEPVLAAPGTREPVAEEPTRPPAVESPHGAPMSTADEEAEEEVVRPPKPTTPAVVLPLSRSPISTEPPLEVRSASGTPVERVLRIAAARGAATVYVVARSQPVIRVDGEISVLDGEPALTAAEIERLVMDLAPARARDAAAPGEWMAEVPDVGRVRCVTFRDHRGPGVIFRMIPPKAISADQLGISSEVQALCAQPDGLVLVTGARASGKSTLLSAFVDLINRTRSDHVITIESQIGFVHESRKSFVSQREVRGNSETAAGAVRSAFREDPDVLVIEDMRTPEIVSAALEAAESGRLVFGSVSAVSTVAAIDRLIEMFAPDRRSQAQTSLASALRGVVAQTLLRKVKGGRIAAREVLLNTPAVASLILEGKTFQLPVALASGRRHGMMPLADSMAALVREGTVHAAEAYRKAPDREALLAALRRDGVDTSFAERLA